MKGVFPSGISLRRIVGLLEKRHGVRMHVRMLKRRLKNRPRKLRPVRRCFLSTFTFITRHSFIILNFIYARKASQIQVRELCKISATVEIHLYQHISEHETQFFSHKLLFKENKLLLKEKNLNVLLRPFYSLLPSLSFFRYSKLYHYAN